MRTTGVSPREMMTSSPAHACSISLERCVFASSTVTRRAMAKYVAVLVDDAVAARRRHAAAAERMRGDDVAAVAIRVGEELAPERVVDLAHRRDRRVPHLLGIGMRLVPAHGNGFARGGEHLL